MEDRCLSRGTVTAESDLREFLKLRLGLVAALAAVIAVGLLGLVSVVKTASIHTVPMYVHLTVGAVVFPVVLFGAEYGGVRDVDALKYALISSVGSFFFVVLLSEGWGQLAGGLMELDASTVFYVASVSLVASTLIVFRLQRATVGRPPTGGSTGTQMNRR